jgi:hypothetical protein
MGTGGVPMLGAGGASDTNAECRIEPSDLTSRQMARRVSVGGMDDLDARIPSTSLC